MSTMSNMPPSPGPNLWGLMGRKTGQAANFSYTEANKSKVGP